MESRVPPNRLGSSSSVKKCTPDSKKLSVPSRYLNSTTASSSKSKVSKTPSSSTGYHHHSRQNLNTTFNANATKLNLRMVPDVTVAPSIDWELECDLAYNEYLQALLKKQLMQRKVTEMKASINDQLSIQSESVFHDKAELPKAQQETETKQLETEVTEAIARLDESLDVFLKIANDCNLEKHFDDIIDMLNVVNNRIGLENIEPLKNQDECNKLASLLVKCNDVLLKITETTGNHEQIEKLADCLSHTLELKKQIVTKDAHLAVKQKTVECNTLKGISDYLSKLE